MRGDTDDRIGGGENLVLGRTIQTGEREGGGGDRKTNVLHSSDEYTPITEFSSRFDFDYTFQLESLTFAEKGVNYLEI
jgi:hypothetical protein